MSWPRYANTSLRPMLKRTMGRREVRAYGKRRSNDYTHNNTDPHCLADSFRRKPRQKVLRDPLPTRRLPTRLPRLRIKNDVVRKCRGPKLSRHEHLDSVNRLRPTVSGQVGILMTVPGDKIFGTVSAEKFRRLAFLASRTRIGPRWYVVEDKPSTSALPSKDISPVKPDRFLFFRTMIRNSRHDQVVHNLRPPIRDNLWLFS